jgi:hypothetical protein
MSEKRNPINRLFELIISEIWGPLSFILIVPAILAIIFPGFRSLDGYFSLLYGSFIFISIIISGPITPLLTAINFEFNIPEYGPWAFSDIVYVFLTNSILITIFAYFIYRRFLKDDFDGIRVKVLSFLWTMFIIQMFGAISIILISQSFGPY